MPIIYIHYEEDMESIAIEYPFNHPKYNESQGRVPLSEKELAEEVKNSPALASCLKHILTVSEAI